MGHKIITEMLGKTYSNVVATQYELSFYGIDEKLKVKFYHKQDCCEDVEIAEIIGDLTDLIGSPLVEAEETSDAEGDRLEYADSYTWTFYRFRTEKGSVVVRWLGESNGYYSEEVDVEFYN